MSESVREVPTFVARGGAQAAGVRVAGRPTAREWAKHGALFLLTGLAMTWAGLGFALSNVIPEPDIASPVTPLGYAVFIPKYFVLLLGAEAAYALAHPQYIVEGLKFAVALLSILLAHESGPYIACRLYGVDATLPYFIPMPPPFMAGTLGAFIKIKSPIPSRPALFAIGVARPLAGFLLLISLACAALLTSRPDRAA